MPSYSVTVHDGRERGIEVTCDDHGESEAFAPGYRKVTFHCEQSGYELGVELHDLHEWRDLAELC